MKRLKNLIHWYRTNYKIWKKFKSMPEVLWHAGYWPSETYMKYPPESTFEGRKVLNFGCGKSIYKSENVTNLDIVANEGVNVVCTDNKLPFENDTFDFIIANHVMEHVPNWFESFKEMARVVKPGGTIEIWIPPVYSDTAFTYRDHINRIGVQSFAGTKTLCRSGHNLSAEEEKKSIGDVSRLEIIRVAKRPAVKWWIMLAWPSLLEFFTCHLRNTVSEEQFVFKKV